jgi:hypothetical protein
MDEARKSLTELFSGMTTNTALKVFENEDVCGFCVSYTEQGFGFGQIAFLLDKKTGEFRGDTECMSPEHVARILQRLAGTVVKVD